MARWDRSHKSWNVNNLPGKKGSGTVIEPAFTMEHKNTSWQKLKLLLWKNWTIQMRHKWQTILELLIPVIFTALLVIMRVIIKSEDALEPLHYPSYPLKHNVPYQTMLRCDKLFYSPKNNFTDEIMRLLHDKYFFDEGLEYNFTGFDTEEELLYAYLLDGGKVETDDNLIDVFLATSPVLAGVIFENNFTEESFPTNLQYKLRFPSSLRGYYDIIEEQTGLKSAWFSDITYPLIQLLGPRARNKTDGGLPGYFEEGFLYLQYGIDQTFMNLVYQSSPEDLEFLNKVDIKMQRFPHQPYTFDLYLFAMQGFLPILMLLSFIYPVINITKSIVYEKEKRLKESMKMMGLENWLHWVAWFIKSYIFLALTCLIITFLLKVTFSEAQKSAIVPFIDATLLYFIFLVFIFSTICFCFFVSSFFSRANPAATGAGALWILFYAPYLFMQPRYNLLPFWVKILFCFMTNIPISISCQIISIFEGSGGGLQWNSLNEGSSPDDNFSMAWALIMMVVNGFLYLIITLYIEAVWPGEFGIPLPYNFFLKKWYWTGAPQDDGFDYDFDSPTPIKSSNIESSSRNMKAGVSIKKLTKKFGSKTAVNQLSLEMYDGQITTLLGHNGAGKTTTISMLTGLFPATSGTAVINGYDIHRDMKTIRLSLGICPQHNVLFDELTVAEHLQFFCFLKGMEKHLIDPEINRLLAALGLESKRHAKSRTLSGGMKRKLSVLIALCGGSKIVLLDECTSGMDSGSRRCTWDLIQNEKKGRTIILSTHFMEEADVLGDRIAIMADGVLQCCGSSLFLKKRYGGGYNLIIVKDPTCVVDNITNLLRNSIPEVEMDQNVGAELSYILPDSQSHLFPEVFEELESKRTELGIASYGCSITTLEEVFMRVLKDAELKASGSDENLDLLVKNTANQHIEINHMDSALIDSSFLFKKEELKRNAGLSRLAQQFWSMLLKKILYVVRNKYLVLVQMILPLFYLVFAFFALKSFPGFDNPIPLNVGTLDKFETVGRTQTLVHCLNNSSSVCAGYIDYVSERFLVQPLEEEITVAERILELSHVNLVALNYKYIVAFEERVNPKSSSIETVAYFNNQPYHGPPLALNFISNALLRKSNHTVTTFNHPLPHSDLDAVKEAGSILTLGFQVGYNITIAMSFLVSAYIVFLVRERQSGCKHLQFVSGVKFWLYWLSHFIVDYITFIIPCIGLLITLNIYEIKEFMDITVQFHFMVLMSLFGIAILPFTYLWSFLATNPTTAFSRLVIFYCFIGLAPMVIMVFLALPGFNLEQYGDIANDYFLIFPNYAMGQGVMQLSVNYHLRSFCGNIQFLEDLCEISNDRYCCQQLKLNYMDWERMGIGKNVVYLMVSAVVYTVMLLCVELKIFKKIADLFRKTESVLDDDSNTDSIEDQVGLEDSDVLMEEDRIRKTDLNKLTKSETLIVRDLTKAYGKFVAVDCLNFAVKPGECFGLLGVNGAGKTTTFKQLTGDIQATSGDAFVCGKSVNKNLRDVHENIGYTPQFDGLIDELTCRETIQMFGRLKGVPEKYIDELIVELGHVLKFSEHLDKWTCNLSGGNKRKLSTACSMVGKPAVILLDEPSSGMDPVARRHLWNAVSMIRDAGTSIVLTTHSLEEAEALCTRMGIMVNGRFRCMGSPQHLKNKFSKGYTLIAQTRMKMLDEMSEPFTRSMEERGRRRSSIRTPRGSFLSKRSPLHWEAALEDLRNFIEDAFPESILKDIHPGFVHYHISTSETTSWGKMFKTMEEARVKFELEAYSVGQTSLEQVFLNFSKAQINEE